MANIPDNYNSSELWAPVVFSYIFSLFYCQSLYMEYVNFIEKRINYLAHGDQDTPQQTYYTVLVENIPSSIKSVTLLTDFFNNLFKGPLMFAKHFQYTLFLIFCILIDD